MSQPSFDSLFDQAIVHHKAGRYREAEQGYRQILARDPNHPGALNLLGVLAGSAGHAQAAVDLIGRAVSIQPNDPDLLNNYATALRQAGRLDEAIQAYSRAVTLREDPDFLMGLGQSYRQKMMFEQALGCFRRAADLRPESVDAHYAFGSLLVQIHVIDPAIPALQKAAELAPHRPEIHRDLGIALHQVQRFAESADACRKALALNPADALALGHLALSLRRLGKPEEANVYFQKIVDLPATGPAETFNRALALENLDRYEDAARVYKQTIDQNPGAAMVMVNLGSVLQQMGEPDKAMEWFDKAMALAPQEPLIHLDRAVVLLLKGNLAEGWKEYDWRWRCPERHQPMRAFPQPLWRDQEVAGKTVLLHAEQGYGDAIQFVRYAPLIKARGAKVIVEVGDELVSIIRTIEGIDQVVTRNGPLPEFDLHAPLMDLPLIFGTVLRTVPANVPYIRSDPHKVAAWAARLAQDEPQGRPRLRVGLVWAGRPTHPYDRTRSIRLEQLAPLATLSSDISFISLQKGPAAEQLKQPPAGMTIRDYADELTDFTQTAALLDNIDLLITVDTAVAHLSGALGRPTWILISIAPDWRWLERRDDSPWYPTVKLFRQQKRGDWLKAIEKLTAELRKLSEKRGIRR